MVVRLSSPEDYEQQGYKLLPMGPAWKQPDPLIQAIADAASRTHNRATDLIEEADPRTTNGLLPDWERIAGLPDNCVISEQSSAERYASLLAKITSLGGQTPAYFIAIAAAIGYDITISEYDEYDVEDDVDEPIYGSDWNFAFLVTASPTESFIFSVNDTVDDPLASWSNSSLECVINRYKPAHTVALFAYL